MVFLPGPTMETQNSDSELIVNISGIQDSNDILPKKDLYSLVKKKFTDIQACECEMDCKVVTLQTVLEV